MSDRLLKRLREEYELFERRGKAVPDIMYHGTSDKFLRSIVKQGLISGGKEGAWTGEDEQASAHNLSRQTVGGIYFTDNILTASGAAGTVSRKVGGEPMIVIAELMRGSMLADEDNISHNIRGVFSRVLSAAAGFGAWSPERAVEFIGWFFSEKGKRNERDAVELFSKTIHGELATEKHKEAPSKLLERLFITLLKRTAAYIVEESGEDSWQTGGKFVDRLEQGSPGLSREEAKQRYSEFVGSLKSGKEYDLELKNLFDKLTKTYTKSARTERGFADNIRIEGPVGFKGRNRIIGIVRPQGMYGKTEQGEKRLEVLWGTVPEEFIEEWKKSVGPDYKIVKVGETK